VDQQTSADIGQEGADGFIDEIERTLRAGGVPTAVGAKAVHSEGRREAATTGDTDGARPGGADGDKAGHRADLRSGLSGVELRIPPDAECNAGDEVIREAGNHGYNYVVDADIRSYFDNIDQEKLMVVVSERISDRRVLKPKLPAKLYLQEAVPQPDSCVE